MPHRRCPLALALAAVSLAACSTEAMFARFVPPAADARARDYLDLFVRGQEDSAVARLVPELRTAEAHVQLDTIEAVLRGRVVDSTRIIGARTNVTASERYVNLTYELHSSAGWVLANVATVDRGGDWAVDGVSAARLAAPLETVYAFTLRGRSARHYLWLLLTVAACVSSVAVAVRVALERRMPKRWRWVLLATIGVGSFTLDWSTGAWRAAPFAFRVLSAGFFKAGPVAPWMLSFSVPLGAFLAERRLRQWRRTPVPAPSPVALEEEPAAPA